MLPPGPSWIARADMRDLTGEAAAFRAGAALAHLHAIATERVEAVPAALWRDRLALGAAEAGIVRAGGRERAGDLRDRLRFLPPGAQMDPAGARLAFWHRAAPSRPACAARRLRACWRRPGRGSRTGPRPISLPAAPGSGRTAIRSPSLPPSSRRPGRRCRRTTLP